MDMKHASNVDNVIAMLFAANRKKFDLVMEIIVVARCRSKACVYGLVFRPVLNFLTKTLYAK